MLVFVLACFVRFKPPRGSDDRAFQAIDRLYTESVGGTQIPPIAAHIIQNPADGINTPVRNKGPTV
jgi:hypothetical protein